MYFIDELFAWSCCFSFSLTYVCPVSMDCCCFSDTATNVLVYATESVENTSSILKREEEFPTKKNNTHSVIF